MNLSTSQWTHGAGMLAGMTPIESLDAIAFYSTVPLLVFRVLAAFRPPPVPTWRYPP